MSPGIMLDRAAKLKPTAAPLHPFTAAQLADPNLLSLWLLDEAAAATVAVDSGPGGQNLTKNGGTFAVAAPIGTGWRAAGGVAGLTGLSKAGIYPFAGVVPFTAEFFVNPLTAGVNAGQSLSPPAFMVGRYGTGGNDDGWGVFTSSGGPLQFWRFNAGSGQQLNASSIFRQNELSLIHCTYDGTNMRSYENGALVGGPLASAVSLPASPGAAFQIGGNEMFQGLNADYDSVALYNAALSAATILDRAQKAGLA